MSARFDSPWGKIVTNWVLNQQITKTSFHIICAIFFFYSAGTLSQAQWLPAQVYLLLLSVAVCNIWNIWIANCLVRKTKTKKLPLNDKKVHLFAVCFLATRCPCVWDTGALIRLRHASRVAASQKHSGSFHGHRSARQITAPLTLPAPPLAAPLRTINNVRGLMGRNAALVDGFE